MARAGPHARLESVAPSGGQTSGAATSPVGTSRPASPRLACSGGQRAGARQAASGPNGPDQQREHRDDGSARQPQGRDDRRRAPYQREGLAAQRVRHAMRLEPPPRSPG
eukprot:scaffold46756_cov58-Phaeocystis_antarctica.AAC.1